MQASPSASAVTAGIKNLGNNPVLIIVLNYTGDRLHFGIAAEKANSLVQETELVVIDDDVSVGRKQGGRVGRRGLAGIVLVQKVAGGCAMSNKSLQDVKTLADSVVVNLVTASVSLTHASVPGSSGEDLHLEDDEVEIGTGIHNEAGFKKQKLTKVSGLVDSLLKQLLDQNDKDRAYVKFKLEDEVVLLINNLGGISTLELYHFTQIVANQLEQTWKLKIRRTYTGAFVTSLDGAGTSVTILNLSNIEKSDIVLEYLDLPTDAPGWNSAIQTDAWTKSSQERTTKITLPTQSGALPIDSDYAQTLISGACNSLIAAEPEITKYDTVAGDGDAGTTLKSAATAVLRAIKGGDISTSSLVDLFGNIATVLEETMGGTGGALYTIYFAALSSYLANSKAKKADLALVGNAVKHALDRLSTYTTATIGDKTMMDALIPFSQTLSSTESLTEAVEAARQGALSTKGMAAGLGRATYVDATATKTVPDAGAVGVWKLVQGISDSSKGASLEHES